MVSMATTAIGNVALPVDPPKNSVDLFIVGLITLASSLAWVWLGERINSAKLLVERMSSAGVGDYWVRREESIATVKSDFSTSVFLLLFTAITLSLSWILVLVI